MIVCPLKLKDYTRISHNFRIEMLCIYQYRDLGGPQSPWLFYFYIKINIKYDQFRKFFINSHTHNLSKFSDSHH